MSLMGATPHRCPLCTAAGHSCGGPSGVVPVDERIERSNPTMTDLKRYNVTVNGHQTVMQLTAEKAKAMGAEPYVPSKPGPRPQTQADVISGLKTALEDAHAEIKRLTAELEAPAEDTPPEAGTEETPAEASPKAAPDPANKSRRPQNKAR